MFAYSKMAGQRNIAIASVVLGVLVLLGMLVWGYFVVKDKECLKCFAQAVGVFLGLGAGVTLIGFGAISLDKQKEKEQLAKAMLS